MSGFVGFLDANGNLSRDENILNQMNEKIKHRGICEPVYNESKNLVIFFDGTSLLSAEEILRGYEEYGEEIVSKLRGAFSFVIYNTETRDLFGARDHFGIKPLYYYNNANLFIFGSEIKSFLPCPGFKKEINKDALKMFLIFQYSVFDETFFKSVFRLPQGCYFNYNFKENNIKITRYFNIDYKTENKSFDEYSNIIEKTLLSSVEYYTKDKEKTEIGGFLSGGVDSSFIVSVTKPKKTFTVGFSVDGFDESMYAKELSDMLNLENHKKIISSDEFFEILPEMQYLCDEPYSNLSGIPQYYAAKLAAEQVKTVLSGEGSDEFFSGYMEFAESRFSRFYSKFPFGFRKFIRKLIKSMPNFKGKATLDKYGQKIEDYYTGQSFIMDDAEANNILSADYKNNMSFRDVTKFYFDQVKDKSEHIKKSYLDLFLWLPNDILLKGDRVSAANGLEVRAPILDKEVFALTSRIPKKYLVKNRVTKYIFRQIANKIMPTEWAKRKKVGFTVPFRFWLKEEKYRDILKDIFSEDFVSEFFERDKLLVMLDEHFSGKKNNGRKLYTVYSFLLWYKVYFMEEYKKWEEIRIR